MMKSSWARAALYLVATGLFLGGLRGQTRLGRESGVVEGIISDARTHQPVSGANVSLYADAGSSGTALSDEAGHFTIQGLAPGQYRIKVARAGYIERNDAPSDVLRLEGNEQSKKLQLELTPAGVIVGRVTNEDGKPQANLVVTAARPEYEDGNRFLSFCLATGGLQSKTDSDGNYRLYGLAPGRYYIVFHSSACNVPPQFFPGVTDPAQAVPVEVEGGLTLRLNNQLVGYESHSIRFNAVDPPVPGTGFLANARVLMHGDNDLRVRVMDLDRYSPLFKKEGDNRYTISGLPPGNYTIYYGTDMLFANIVRFNVSLVDRDVDIGTISSAVVVEGLTGKVSGTLPTASAGRVRVRLHADDGPFPSTYFRANRSELVIIPGGTFQFQYLAGQRYFIEVTGLPANSYLASARYGGQDVLDQGILLDSQPRGSLELEIREMGGSIEGMVRDNRKVPFRSGTAVLVPVGARRRNPLLFRTSSVNESGAYSFQGVLPGEYLLLAWEQVEPGAWQNENFLERFVTRSTKVTVREGIQSQLEIQGIRRE